MERVPVISEIADVIDSRKGGDPKVSYVAKLFSKAPDAALKKVGDCLLYTSPSPRDA